MIYQANHPLLSSGNNLSVVVSRQEDEKWMQRAIELAERARAQDEVPIGAVIVRDDELIGEGWNQPIAQHDPSAHAEIMALREAGHRLNNYRIVPDATLYVTLEPCAMCVGAIVHARIARLVFGTSDIKAGAVTGRVSWLDAPHFNHHTVWEGGVLADSCVALLQNFFSKKRNSKDKNA